MIRCLRHGPALLALLLAGCAGWDSPRSQPPPEPSITVSTHDYSAAAVAPGGTLNLKAVVSGSNEAPVWEVLETGGGTLTPLSGPPAAGGPARQSLPPPPFVYYAKYVAPAQSGTFHAVAKLPSRPNDASALAIDVKAASAQ